MQLEHSHTPATVLLSANLPGTPTTPHNTAQLPAGSASPSHYTQEQQHGLQTAQQQAEQQPALQSEQQQAQERQGIKQQEYKGWQAHDEQSAKAGKLQDRLVTQPGPSIEDIITLAVEMHSNIGTFFCGP